MRLVEVLGELRRPELSDRDRGNALLRLQLLQLGDRDPAHQPALVRGIEHGGIERGEDLAPGVVAQKLEHHGVGDLFRGDELHLAERGDRFELAAGEEPVLAGVHAREREPCTAAVRGVERLEPFELRLHVQRVDELLLPRPKEQHRLGRRDAHAIFAASVSRAILRPADHVEADVLVADHRRGLDLLDDRGTWSARHEEEESGLRESGRGLRHERGTRLVLAVRVRNVEPHASRAGRAHLDVNAGAQLGERTMQEAHVQDELRHRAGDEMLFHVGGERVVHSRRDRFLQSLGDDERAGECILVADARGRVHRVDDGFGADFEEQANQHRFAVGGVEVEERVREDRAAVLGITGELGGGRLRSALLDGSRRAAHEQVSVVAGDLDAREFLAQRLDRLAGLFAPQGRDHQTLRLQRAGDLLRALHADEAGASQHEHGSIALQHRLPRFRFERVAPESASVSSIRTTSSAILGTDARPDRSDPYSPARRVRGARGHQSPR